MKATETTGLTKEQRAKLAYVLEVIRLEQGSTRKWTQYRNGDVLYLLRRNRAGRLQEAYHVCQAAHQP